MTVFRSCAEWEEAGEPHDDGDWGFGSRHGELNRCINGEWQEAGNFSQFDLSPLAKWIKGPTETELLYPSRDGCFHWERLTVGYGRYFREWIWNAPTRSWCLVGGVTAEMYGPVWPDFGTSPPPTPDPSPMDKALDEKIKEAEFTARRKAKREFAPTTIPADDMKRWAAEEALDRAMSKLIPAEMDFRSRLVNAKVAM